MIADRAASVNCNRSLAPARLAAALTTGNPARTASPASNPPTKQAAETHRPIPQLFFARNVSRPGIALKTSGHTERWAVTKVTAHRFSRFIAESKVAAASAPHPHSHGARSQAATAAHRQANHRGSTTSTTTGLSPQPRRIWGRILRARSLYGSTAVQISRKRAFGIAKCAVFSCLGY